jgi:transcriptional regulator with XRE-family HTH domain
MTMSSIEKNVRCKLNHIGSNIQKARVAAGLTQTQLGEALGWNQPTVNVLENGGRANILLSQLQQIAGRLEIDVNQLLKAPESKPIQTRRGEGFSPLKVESYRTGLGETKEEFIDSVLERFYPSEYASGGCPAVC